MRKNGGGLCPVALILVVLSYSTSVSVQLPSWLFHLSWIQFRQTELPLDRITYLLWCKYPLWRVSVTCCISLGILTTPVGRVNALCTVHNMELWHEKLLRSSSKKKVVNTVNKVETRVINCLEWKQEERRYYGNFTPFCFQRCLVALRRTGWKSHRRHTGRWILRSLQPVQLLSCYTDVF